MLDLSTSKEEFSLAYLHAIAAAAGFAMEYRRVDRFGIDIEILFGSFRIDVQMKCTAEGDQTKPIAYPLDARTFNFLVEPDRTVPGFLMVVEVPDDQTRWTKVGHDRLSLFRFGYYREMHGLTPIPDNTTKTVHLNRKHRLSVSSLTHIMTVARTGQAVHPVRGPVVP
jgi:hypothetical protein